MSYHQRSSTAPGGGGSSSFPQPPSPSGIPTRSSSSLRSPGSSSLRSPGSTSGRRTVSISAAGGLPPPPPVPTSSSQQQQRRNTTGSVTGTSTASFSQNIAKSMTIDEMRDLHRRALHDAESKRTELRLVLASRYRELVGSSDEVIKMKERAQELHDLVQNLPLLMNKLVSESSSSSSSSEKKKEEEEEKKDSEDSDQQENVLVLRRELSYLPRYIYRNLDINDLYRATSKLIELFALIANHTDTYQLATVLSSSSSKKKSGSRSTSTDGAADNTQNTTQVPVLVDPVVEGQMRMVYLQMQTLPSRILRIAHKNLLRSASYGKSVPGDPSYGAEISASALASLHLLTVVDNTTKNDDNSSESSSSEAATKLLDAYFDSKAKLLQSLLNKLTTDKHAHFQQQQEGGGQFEDIRSPPTITATGRQPNNAEEILSKIVLILQYDIILHPYQIFILKQFPTKLNDCQSIVNDLPSFGGAADAIIKMKVSKFLASHLPLIRTKVKTILVTIAGTTASALGKIRQSLYDKTDGKECIDKLNGNGSMLEGGGNGGGGSQWQDAINAVIDIRTIQSQGGVATGLLDVAPASGPASTSKAGGGGSGGGGGASTTSSTTDTNFSLWSALFSNTFSSLVHSLLTSAFSNVHKQLVHKLRASLQNAPRPMHNVLPHEAYHNTLAIATDLNLALLKVSDDAHELLVHAEEREESERRLRQSLYVQTCEIMGRLVCELRRMVANAVADDTSDATKELIVGRLCYLLKFRLTSLPTLLDPKSSPAALSSMMQSNNTNPPSPAAASAATTATGGSSGGLISFVDLQSAFDLADDNGDGLITFEEAMHAVESAFSGTRFRGAEMVRETLLLPSVTAAAAAADGTATAGSSTSGAAASGSATAEQQQQEADGESSSKKNDVTLTELTLLVARGLRHELSGQGSALGTVQQALDDITQTCFYAWSSSAIKQSIHDLNSSYDEFMSTACSVVPDDKEWQRLHPSSASPDGGNDPTSVSVQSISPYVICHLLDISSILNRTTCPSDYLPPVPTTEYAISLGIIPATTTAQEQTKESIPTLADNLRWALLRKSITATSSILDDGDVDDEGDTNNNKNNLESCKSSSALAQYMLDVSFMKHCFFERNRYGFGPAKESPTTTLSDENEWMANAVQILDRCISESDGLLSKRSSRSTAANIKSTFESKYNYVFEVSDLSFSSLLGASDSALTSAAAADLDLSIGGGRSASMTSTTAAALIRSPLPSARRFVLLPVQQADRSLSEIQLRGKYASAAREKEASHQHSRLRAFDGAGGPGVVSSGLGFLSSMLKKN